jgi:hypothetical protein
VSTRTIVTLPDGTTVPLDDLQREVVAACDGCGATPGMFGLERLIPAENGIHPVSDSDGEGSSISGHLCGREECSLSAMARHFEAIWPLPEVEDQP